MRSSEVKAQVQELRARIEASLHEGTTGGLALGRQLATGFDDLLIPLLSQQQLEGIAIAGVGTYGRGALSLRSDLDLRILVRRENEVGDVAERVLYPLWDAGLSVGHQVVVLGDVVELAREDLKTATSLLDWRHLAGDASLSDEVVWRVSGSLFSQVELVRFGERLGEEVTHRHERFGDSVFLLEPDLKNGAGGLRDFDVMRWAARARYGTGEVDTLLRQGALASREAADLAAAEDLLWRFRMQLHVSAGRKSDRLTFDEQETLARALGYSEGGQAEDGDAVERLMSDYYRAARVVSRGVTMMLGRLGTSERRKPKVREIEDGFQLVDEQIAVESFAFSAHPWLALRAVQLAVEYGARIHPHTREHIARLAVEAAFAERLRADPRAQRCFVELVSSRREGQLACGSTPRELHDLGLILAMVPEFSPVVGRVHHDLYHVYTVDVHSVAALEKLSVLSRGELVASYPLASRLAADAENFTTLAFATLLHDVGKAIGRKDHSERGAELALEILARLGLSADEAREASLLIGEHLTMFRLATRRDIDDPATIEELISKVASRERLRHLYLLTVADVSTTSPTSLTSWKAHLLDELFVATDQTLSGKSGEVGRAEILRREIVGFARGYLEPQQLELELLYLPDFLASMPDRYLVSSSPESILEHSSAVRVHQGLFSLHALQARHEGAVELCVVAADRPGLLALLASAITAARLEILAANVFTRQHGDETQAVDVFWVQHKTDGPDGVTAALPRLERELSTRLQAGLSEVAPVLPALPAPRRRAPQVTTRVHLDHRASHEHTIVEVFTQDRPGLLSAIAHTLFCLRLSIHVAKIHTEGARVADVFYVREQDGQKLLPGARAEEVSQAVLRALGVEARSPQVSESIPSKNADI